MPKSDREMYREVYSTDKGTICPGCGKPTAQCSCVQDKQRKVLGDGHVRVRRETKGRGGKTVTCVTGLKLNTTDLSALLKEFKQSIGTGGALKDGAIELQGDHCDAIMRDLVARGYKPKRSGG